MRAPTLLTITALLACTLGAGCRQREVPPPPKPVTAWTATLSTGTAATIVDAIVADGWVNRFRETNGRQPVLAVGPFEDRSADHVPVDELTAAFQTAIAASDRVLAAKPGQVADATLGGVVGLRAAADGSKEYTIDARVVDKAGDTQWVSGIARPRP